MSTADSSGGPKENNGPRGEKKVNGDYRMIPPLTAIKAHTGIINLVNMTDAVDVAHVSGPSTAALAAGGAAPALNSKSPDNAREILQALDQQHWKGQLLWASDGARNLITPEPEPAAIADRNLHLPVACNGPGKEFRVEVLALGKSTKKITWKVTFGLVRPPISMEILAHINGMLSDAVQSDDAKKLDRVLAMWLERRQPLEWVLKQALLGQGMDLAQGVAAVMEVRRSLYFLNNRANRNIGGGLKAIAGLQSSMRLTDGGLMWVANLGASAFLRTDITLVEFMADLLGFNGRGGGGGGRGWGFGNGRGGGGRGGGRGGQGPSEVGEPDVEQLLQAFRFDGRSFPVTLWHKISKKVKNKKMIYTPRDGKSKRRCVATGISREPASRAMFLMRYKDNTSSAQGRHQQQGAGEEGIIMSVAAYYADVKKMPLKFPELPVVVMKPPKDQDKLWLPPEMLSFAPKQRIMDVSHKGGTEQMIAAAQKTPADFPVEGRVLPQPSLVYGFQGEGRNPSKTVRAINPGREGQWNLMRGLQFADGAELRSWGVLVALPEGHEKDVNFWTKDLIIRMRQLGLELWEDDYKLCDAIRQNAEWVDERATLAELEGALQRLKEKTARSFGRECQLVLCIIPSKPHRLYGTIKAICELDRLDGQHSQQGQALGLVTQFVVAEKTDVLHPGPSNRRNQYQANLAMKINTKCGGINTRLAVTAQQLLQRYFQVAQVPSIMVIGIDLTHPGQAEWRRSKAAMVGSIDQDFCRYGHQIWEETDAGSEMLTAAPFKAALKALLLQYCQAQGGRHPGVLLIYRDGVSDGELLNVRRHELDAVLEACKEMDGEYRPLIVYIVVQKRHHVRLVTAEDTGRPISNLAPGTVVDSVITSPYLFDFYLNSHKALKGTSKVPRYICLLDELGFGADGLQLLSYWLCYLSVSVVTPVAYAHLLAYRARVLEDELFDDSASLSSGGSGSSSAPGATIKLAGGQASIRITLPNGPTDLYRIVFRGSYSSKGAKLVAVSSGGITTVVANLNSTSNYKDIVLKGLWQQVTQLQFTSKDTFTLIELAAQYSRCFESATVDMQAVQTVHMIRARWWAGGTATNTSMFTSQDNVTWALLRNLNPNALYTADFWLDTPQQIRFIMVKHTVLEDDWKKVYVWEVGAYGQGGRWGPAPAPVQQTRTFREILGVNGIWGWGFNAFSDSLLKQGSGPLLYNKVASSGRNYESMVWDVKKPGNDPKWDTMKTTGTDGQWWLDWDREYFAWKNASLPVDVSFQFTNRDQPAAAWGPDPYAVSYDLGFKFARHFGKTAGTGSVESFEAGNEPWDYNATFYTTLLRGFIDGLYAGDPIGLKRLPCALQAHDPFAETTTGGNYIGARVPESLAGKVDALNTHVYSFFYTDNSVRIAVHPEHPGSFMNGIHNMLAWRNVNMPSTPLWVTEWGWDASRPDQPCDLATTECVSQLAQAAYGIRGLAMMARKGVQLAHWFFYANDDKCNTLFCRSGLRDTKTAGFAELPVYRAFAAFIQAAGGSQQLDNADLGYPNVSYFAAMRGS
eukprot:gene9931-10086_t